MTAPWPDQSLTGHLAIGAKFNNRRKRKLREKKSKKKTSKFNEQKSRLDLKLTMQNSFDKLTKAGLLNYTWSDKLLSGSLDW